MTAAAHPPPSRGLGQAAVNRLLPIALALPAALVVLMVLYVPIAWMAWVSFQNEAGWTLEHYGQLGDPNNLGYLLRTFRIAAIVTALALLVAFPTAYGISLMPRRLADLCMLLVLMPFFTSILVRTYAWMLLLQRRGLINTWLVETGIVEQPLRLVYNEVGTVIGMLHVLVPLAILPIYGALRALDGSLVAAAATLGASPVRRFLTITLPQATPGIAAGGITVFVLSLGFYVTPAVLGGGRVVTWAMLVETVLLFNPQWGAASALGIALLVLTLLVLWAGKAVFGLRGGQRFDAR
ncbi:ABC transporter permease [Allostella vacuolata]|nr:ABC transporter permease [Stella vacuolata]